MNFKKILAVSAALTLAMSSMTVFAADTSLTEPGAGSDETISGDVNYVKTTIYKVTLPTTTGLDFALDPQGLSSLDGSGYDATQAGSIVSTGTMTAKNESSVDVTVTGKFYVADSTGKLALVDLANKDKLDNTKQEICLTIQQKNADGDFDDAVAVTGTAADSATELTFDMDKATYKFGGDKDSGYTYELDTTVTDNFSSAEMQIGGIVAKDYDWSAYKATTDPATITLHAVFSFAAKAETPAALQMKLKDGTVLYNFNNDGAAPEGTLTAVTVDGTSRTGQIAKGGVSYSGGKLVFSASGITSCGLDQAGTHNVTATIGDTEYILVYTKE